MKEDEEEDAFLEACFDKLEHERGAASAVKGVKLAWFGCALRGGESEERKMKDRFDCWQGQVQRGSRAQTWCKTNGLQHTKQFSLTLGDMEALILARSWAERMDYIFRAEEDGLLTTGASARATMDRFEEAADFRDLAGSSVVAIQAEVAMIRSLEPPAAVG